MEKECRKFLFNGQGTKEVGLLQGARSKWRENLVREGTAAIKKKFDELKHFKENKGPEQMAGMKRVQHELGFLLDQGDLRWKQRA